MRLLLGLLLAGGCEVGGEGGEGGEGSGGGEGEGDEGDEGGGGTHETGGYAGTCDADNESCTASTCGGEGATMLPGANCLNCHTGGEPGKFTVGGTVFTDIDGTRKQSGATVRIFDADGNTVTLTSNSVGNFYSTKSLAFPITAEVEIDGATATMATPQSTAACNSCHQCDGAGGGKLYVP